MPSAITGTVLPVLLVLSFDAYAQRAGTADPSQASRVDPVVVTADRSAQALSDTLPQTSLFDRQAIEDSTALDLPSLLQQAPGAQVVSNGAPGSAASLFLRGAASTQSLILINGVRVDSVSAGSVQLSQLPLDQIDHVEVVNGNVSALYGSGAIGGVVQIFTKDGNAHPPRANVSLSYGSYQTQSQQVGVDGALDKAGKTTFSLSLSRFKDNGYSSIDTRQAPQANPNDNGYLNQSVSASLRHKFNADWNVGANYFQTYGKDSFDDADGAPDEKNMLYSQVRQASVYAHGKLAPWWNTHVVLSKSEDRDLTRTDDVGAYRYDTDNRQYTWQNEIRLAARQQLQFGYEHLDQKLDSDSVQAPERHVDSGFIGYVARFGRSQFQLNGRHDQYSDFGGANSYYLGYGFDLTRHWRWSTSYSDAFRAPSFDDLYYPHSGNPSLKPERSHSVEAAVQYASAALGVLRLTAFQTQYTDLLTYTPVNAFTYLAENANRAKVQGLESSWSGRIGKTELRASTTFQNPVDQAAHRDLPRRPRHFASLSAHRNLGDWRLGGEWLGSGRRHDSGGQPLGAYNVFNLSARLKITPAWHAAIKLQNLLDKRYQLAYSYKTAGRGVYFSMGWQQPCACTE